MCLHRPEIRVTVSNYSSWEYEQTQKKNVRESAEPVASLSKAQPTQILELFIFRFWPLGLFLPLLSRKLLIQARYLEKEPVLKSGLTYVSSVFELKRLHSTLYTGPRVFILPTFCFLLLLALPVINFLTAYCHQHFNINTIRS